MTRGRCKRRGGTVGFRGRVLHAAGSLRCARVSVLPSRFAGRLALLALAGLVVRVVYTVLHRHAPIQGDALTYYLDATHLADGHGFQRAFEQVPTAEHPPLHIVVLAALRLIGLTGYNQERVALCFAGAATVVVIGLLAREIAGERVGLWAAAIAAVYPNLWIIDGSLLSETEYAFFITLTAWQAVRYLKRPTRRDAALLGAAIAVATLTRGEAVALVVLLGLPLAWRAAGAWRPRAVQLAVIVAAFAVVMAPWTIRNLVTFADPVLISTNGDGVVAGANCDQAYYGSLIGSWSLPCLNDRAPGDESQYSKDYRSRGLRYIRHHAGRLPVVLAARMGRMLEVYRPDQSAFFQATEGKSGRVAQWGIRAFWVLALLAIAGFVLLRRRGAPLWPLGSLLVLALLVTLTVYGSTRLRTMAEPALVVLAAVAVDAAVSRVRSGSAGAWRRPGSRLAT